MNYVNPVLALFLALMSIFAPLNGLTGPAADALSGPAERLTMQLEAGRTPPAVVLTIGENEIGRAHV